ncbi:MAG: chalcone isomerase family protein [Acidobacteriota bacterium]
MMNQKRLNLFVYAFIILLIGSLPVLAQNVKEPSTGVDFPAQVNVGGANLKITGTGVRKRFIVKVYAIASYMEESKIDKSRDLYTQLLTDGPTKQLVLQFVRSVDAGSIREAFQEGLKNNIPSYDASPAKKDGDAFLNAQADVNTNDQVVLRWSQGGKLELIIKGQTKATFQNPTLARGVWSIWLGGSPIDKGLKATLIANAK